MACRPQRIPGNGGSSWTMASPAATRARAVRIQARNVRSLAKVKRASGSGSGPADAGGAGLPGPLASVCVSSPAVVLGLHPGPGPAAGVVLPHHPPRMRPARRAGASLSARPLAWVYARGEAIGAAIAVMLIGLVRGMPTRLSGSQPRAACRPADRQRDPGVAVSLTVTSWSRAC